MVFELLAFDIGHGFFWSLDQADSGRGLQGQATTANKAPINLRGDVHCVEVALYGKLCGGALAGYGVLATCLVGGDEGFPAYAYCRYGRYVILPLWRHAFFLFLGLQTVVGWVEEERSPVWGCNAIGFGGGVDVGLSSIGFQWLELDDESRLTSAIIPRVLEPLS